MHVYYPASGQVYYERLRHASIYHDRLEVVEHPIRGPGLIDTGPGFAIEAERLDHPVETFGYRLREHDRRRFVPERLERLGIRGPAVARQDVNVSVAGGRRIELEALTRLQRGQRFAFVMDTRPCAGARALLEQADLAVLEATFTDDAAACAAAYGHLTIGEACALAREAGVKRLVLAHLSQRYPDPAPLCAMARAHLPDVVVAEDGMRVAVPARRVAAEPAR